MTGFFQGLRDLFASPPASPAAQRHVRVTPTGDRFEFDLVPQRSGEVRVYIVSQPGYGGRAADGHSTHRYHDPRRGHYVCVDTKLAPTNVRDAASWADYWADGTARYIRTGRAFS